MKLQTIHGKTPSRSRRPRGFVLVPGDGRRRRRGGRRGRRWRRTPRATSPRATHAWARTGRSRHPKTGPKRIRRVWRIRRLRLFPRLLCPIRCTRRRRACTGGTPALNRGGRYLRRCGVRGGHRGVDGGGTRAGYPRIFLRRFSSSAQPAAHASCADWLAARTLRNALRSSSRRSAGNPAARTCLRTTRTASGPPSTRPRRNLSTRSRPRF